MSYEFYRHPHSWAFFPIPQDYPQSLISMHKTISKRECFYFF